MEKYTKRASARIIKEILKYRESVSGNTTYDQAYVILMTEWDMECGIEKTLTKTKCDIFFSQLFVRPPQTAILLFCISFPWGWSPCAPVSIL